jgi:DNA polymerase I-like protein with 3'-5' exonuclease and polymerase domains
MSPTCYSARDVIVLDRDEWGLKWDLDAVESRLFSAYAAEEDDIRAYCEGLDLHTITCCTVYELPLPPDLRHPHTSSSCVEWRAQVGWEGKEDKRRVTSKNLRYGVLQYGKDEKSAAEIRDVEQLGLTRDYHPDTGLYFKARKLLLSKPKYMLHKKLVWGQAIETGETRTFLGRKRRFYPDRRERQAWQQRGVPGDCAKAGLNHTIQGAVADIMNLTLIEVDRLYPESVLHLNAHDGAFVGFPASYKPEDVIPTLTPVIARLWDVAGRQVPITADGKIVYPDGKSERIRFEVNG